MPVFILEGCAEIIKNIWSNLSWMLSILLSFSWVCCWEAIYFYMFESMFIWFYRYFMWAYVFTILSFHFCSFINPLIWKLHNFITKYLKKSIAFGNKIWYYNWDILWGYSSAGRALEWHSSGYFTEIVARKLIGYLLKSII